MHVHSFIALPTCIIWLLFTLNLLGGRTEDAIVNWVKKKSGPPAVTITEAAQVEKMLENQVAIIGFFEVSLISHGSI